MTAQTAYPVIQIIDGDKQYVGPLSANTDLQSPIRQYRPAERWHDPAQRR
jgi:hypothetical protein